MKWTDDQKKSIFARPAQIVVSAAAGSGKTQVLTTRIIERIKDMSSPVSVDKLLIVTFTKAAAAEMKERIGKALRNAAKNETDLSVRKHLKAQLSLLGSAHICTIDSFCYDVVKQNFFKADLPSDISIGENGELSLLRLSALEETVDSLYCALEKSKGTSLSEENLECAAIAEKCFPDENELKLILTGFEALTNTCSHDKRDSEFSENIIGTGDYTTMISDLYRKAQSAAYPEKWLSDAAAMYDDASTDYTDTLMYKYSYSVCIHTVQNAAKVISELAEVSETNGIGYEAFLREEADSLLQLASCNDYDELYDIYHSNKYFSALRGLKRGCDKETAERIKTLRTKIKDTVSKTLSSLSEFSLEDCISLRTQLYPQIKALCSAAILLGKIYYKKMTARRIIDFSSCEHLALNIISDDGVTLSETGIALRNKYDEIYIDEFQDSNDLQDMLFSLISKGRTFMVGDVKQSIYGFRNADPSLFMARCDSSSFEEDAAKRKIFLAKNFRSKKNVIDGINSIFDVIMTEESSSINYKKEHRLDFGADFIPENYPVEKCELAIITEDGNAENQKKNEATYIAETIKEIIASKRLVWDKDEGNTRPVRYSDIAVLSRSLKSSVSIYENAFASVGVPCYVDGGNDLYETIEVGQILEILKLIDNGSSDISLACALRSPMFMFDENELLKIKLCSKESFCDAFYGICSGEYKISPTLAAKCRKFKKQLDLWRKASMFVSVEEIIRRIYTDTNIYSSVLSFPDGELRRANLDLLLEKAEEFERSTYNGLFNFVNYIEKIKKTSDVTSEARAISEKMDVVRIMTIHKSKGLEFHIVFVAACASKYKPAKEKAGGLVMNSHAGIAMNVINPLLRCKYSSPMRSILLDMETKENAREEMRLLYVALSRAREKLYAVATLANGDAFDALQLLAVNEISANEILSAKSYVGLIALAYARGADKHWNVTVNTIKENEKEALSSELLTSAFEEDKEVSSLLDFVYPYEGAVNLPNKASVSYLKSLDLNLAPSEDGKIPLLNKPSCKKVSLKKPDFGKKTASGTFYGTAHHKVLEHIDYSGESVQEQCKAFLEKGFISEDEYNVLSFDKIGEFMESPLGTKLKNAQKLYREQSFVIYVDANEIDPSLPQDEKICVQGVIDCYFEHDDSTVILVDYKTDSYDDPSEIAEKYHKQLYYYEKALKTKFKDKIIQKYLYLLHKNDIIEL